jgi:PAS domain S-box-containing protein
MLVRTQSDAERVLFNRSWIGVDGGYETVNGTIVEFLLQQASDATELAQRARVLATLTELPDRRRNELAQAVNVVCRTIAAQGGQGKVSFALVRRGAHQFLEVCVQDSAEDDTSAQPSDEQDVESHSPERSTNAADTDNTESSAAPPEPDREQLERTTCFQRVGELVDHFESSGWPFAGAVIRMAQALSPAFAIPTESEVADWAAILKANTTLDALALAHRRAHSLELALTRARRQRALRTELAGRAAAENLTMLSAVVNKTKNAISIMDANGMISWVNEAFVNMTGYSATEAIGHRPDELLFGPSTEPAAVRALHRALSEGIEWTQDVMQYRRDGQTFWVESNIIPVHNARGELVRWIGVDSDITERRRTEDALREAKETAEANSRAKSDFLANLSHEIRTPMNAIIGMTELALTTDLNAEQRDYLDTVRSSADSLLGLLNSILDLSKIEAGKMPVESAEFSLRELVSDTLKALSGQAKRRRVTVSAQLPDDLPDRLIGDAGKLRQILFNLIDNAIKFTEDGQVVVKVDEQWRGSGEVGLHFSVQDNGIGIPAEQLDKIFEAFSQGDSSTTRKFGGSGLGLTITSELVRLLDGRIWVNSTVGEGSTFHFSLHLEVSKSAPAADSVASPGSTGAPNESGESEIQPLSVLVADDHAANRQLVTKVLGKRGHQCVEADDGQQVLSILRQQQVDVVLMDVQMPGMDGYQATKAIRQQETNSGRHLPIIAVTAHAMTGDREKCLAAGMDAYLAKPLRPSVLVDTVEATARLAHGLARKTRSDSIVEGGDMHETMEFDFSQALESLDNDTELLIDQMGFFLNDGPSLVDQIEQAIDKTDARQLELGAHRLKGLLARYAYHDAAGLAYDLERMGRERSLDSASDTCQQLRPMVRRLASAIRQYIAEQQS